MMAQPFPAGMGPGHPGMGGHGHPMAAMQHPGAGHMGGPPGPAMMQGMHPGVSGPQVTQGPMVTGMPQGPGTPAPGPMHNGSMAMAHLGPQQHMFQQQNPQMAQFGQMQVSAQQQALLRQQMMQRMQQQQHQQGGMPMGMQNNPNFQAQQMAQMKMAGMPMQQQQQMQHPNYQHMATQQQLQLQAHVQRQAQAAAMAAQNQARQAQQMQLSRSQEQQASQAPQPHPTPAPQNQPQPQQQPTPQSQPQQAQPKPQPQQQPATSQAPSQPIQQIKQIDGEDEPQIKQPDPGAIAMMQDIPKEQILVGHSILQLIMFQDSLASPERPNDLSYWEEIIRKYFASYGSLKQQFFNSKTQSDKYYQLQFPSLARFYHAHFGSGIRQILLQSYDHVQSRTAIGGTCVNSSSASLTYVFNNDIRVTTQGALLVMFDESNKIVRFDLSTHGWQEYIPRSILLNPPSPDQKQSPKMNKNIKKVQQQAKQPNPRSDIPTAGISDFGVPTRLIGFLEVAEVITQMQPLMEYYHGHAELGPRESLNRLNNEHQQNFAQAYHARVQNQMARQANGQIAFPNNAGPGMNGPNQFASPGMAHLGLPQGQGSPHIGGPVHTPSPAHNPGAGGVSMMHQMSAQGSNLSGGSQGPSTNTSPNVTNKRRRPSAIKLEEENASQESNAGKVKQSPRVGGKRQKAG